MKTYKAHVKDQRTGATFPVVVQAESQAQAKMIVEGQYGARNVVHPPHPT